MDFENDIIFEPKPSPPCVFVLFGATGDLAGRKIAPALYNLYRDGLLDERTAVLGVARRPRSDEAFREEHFDLRPEDFRLIITNPDRRRGQPRSVSIQL